MAAHSNPRRELIAIALLAVGAVVAISVSGPASVIGILLMSLGWGLWLVAADSLGHPGTAPHERPQRLPWIAISAVFMLAGTLGVHFDIGQGLPALVVLLVGASVWCLIPLHRGLVIEGGGPAGWTSLVIAGGLNRWAALTLVSNSVHAGLAPGRALAGSNERVVECLIVAGSAACACCLGRLWHTRKQRDASQWIVCIIQLQTSIALAAIAAVAWSRISPSTGQIEVLIPRFGELPALLVAWDSFVTAILCGCMTGETSDRFRRSTMAVGTLAILDLAGIPPLPGFWLKWWTLEVNLYPYHLEPLAGMFDLHEGFRWLALLLTVGHTCVTIRLLTWMATRTSSMTGRETAFPRGHQHASGTQPVSINHE